MRVRVNGSMSTHKDLDIWKNGIVIVEEVYKLCKQIPDDEKFGLISQLKRASVSIPSNIAEGAARQSTKEYIQFIYIALGSLSEIETQIIIAHRLNYISDTDILVSIENERKQILNFIKYLKSKM